MTELNRENVTAFNRYRPALDPISELYFWGTNYDFGNNPYSLFLDLIGYSDELGIGKCFDYNKNFSNLGYLELDYLADALKAYAEIGADAYEFVRFMDELEAEEAGE